MSRFCFYCILFSVLGTTVAASMPPVMALWAESNPSQRPQNQDQSRINFNLIKAQSERDPAGTLSAGVIA